MCIRDSIFWVVSVLSAGYFFGNIPIVKNNFEIVVLAIVFISVLPPILHWLKARSKKEIALDPIPKETTVDSNPPTQ